MNIAEVLEQALGQENDLTKTTGTFYITSAK